MLSDNFTSIIVALFALLSTGGIWSWIQLRSKQSFEQQQANNADKVQFRENLIAQVEELKVRVYDLQQEVKELRAEILDLTKKLAESETKRQHAEDIIRAQRLK